MKKSFMTRVLAVSLSAAMAFSLSSATSLTAPEAAAKKLAANKKAVSISLKVGKSKVLKLKNYKAWNIKAAKSNKKAVASVANKGTKAKRTVNVTANKAGTAKVTLTLGKRKTADSKATKYSKTIKKVVTVKVTKAATDDTTPTDTTPTDTPTDTTPTTPTNSAVNVTPGALYISQVAATHADTIAVSFSSIVASTGAVKITVTRGTGTTPIEGTVKWNAEATGVEFKALAKLTKGTYTVTATDGKDTTTGTVEIAEAQEVKSIEFMGDTALTGRDKANEKVGYYAYVYYDVKDQYGDSVRDQYSIQWTSSAKVDHVDRATGRIRLLKNTSGSEVFTYADKIYVTGVFTKTGVTNSATFSVGTEQSVNTIDLVGFAKKGSSVIEEKLPKDFKANQYQLLYNAYDQNGNAMEAGDYLYDDTTAKVSRSLTFVSENVLVVKEILDNDGNTATVSGVEYCAANVVPGINVNAGGTVNLSAIATKTGQKTTFSVIVGDYRILKKFDIQVPSGNVIDGESVEIPFVAEDAEGNRMTNFKELATQSNFNKLTLNESAGRLVLEERNDGSARLVWYDTSNEGDWGSGSTNDVDRPISLTAIVVGGETSNQLIQVTDKARPDGIADVDIDAVMVDGKTQNISYGHFTFVDQYGRNMTNTYKLSKENELPVYYTPEKDWDDKYVYDNGFFDAAADGKLSGNDFSKYTFGLGIEIKGEAKDENVTPATGLFSISSGNADYVKYYEAGDRNTEKPSYDVNEVSSGKIPEVTLKFAIQKFNTADSDAEVEDVSKKVTKSFKIVALDQLSNYRIKDLDKVNINTDLTNFDNGQKLVDYFSLKGDAANTLDVALTNGYYDLENNTTYSGAGTETETIAVENDNQGGVEVVVEGTYNGTDVEIPAAHFVLKNEGKLVNSLGKDEEGNGNRGFGDNKLVSVAAGEMQYKDLYDISTSHFNRKEATDTVEVVVYPASNTTDPDSTNSITSLKKTATISDEYKTLDTFEAADTFTLRPSWTGYSLINLMRDRSTNGLAFASKDHKIVMKDQYGTTYYELDAFNLYDDPTGLQTNVQETYLEDGSLYSKTYYGSDFEFEFLVKDIVENKDGYVDGNLKVGYNATEKAYIEGAEMGDTFTVEITAKAKDAGTIETEKDSVTNNDVTFTVGASVDGSITKTVKVTVGADQGCYIHDNDNYYSDSELTYDANGIVTNSKSVRDELQYQLDQLLGREGTKNN